MDEIRALAEKIAAIEDEDVADISAVIADLYRNESFLIRGMLAFEMEEVPDDHPMMAACVERLRSRLKGLLAWAEGTGRA